MAKILWFDVETAPEVNRSEFDSYPKKRLREEKMKEKGIEADIFEDYKEKCWIYPEFSKVVCISYLPEWEEIKTLIGTDESAILKQFNEALTLHKSYVIWGFNIYWFDIPFLRKRMIINGIQPHPLLCIADTKPRELTVVDVMQTRKQTSFGCSLDLLSITLLGESPKAEIDWADVGELFYSGELEKIKKYCEWDVLATKRCHEKILLQKEEMTIEQLNELKKNPKYLRSFSNSEDLIQKIRTKYKVSDEMRIDIGELWAYYQIVEEKTEAEHLKEAWLPF